jgi:hypothetical protein
LEQISPEKKISGEKEEEEEKKNEKVFLFLRASHPVKIECKTPIY